MYFLGVTFFKEGGRLHTTVYRKTYYIIKKRSFCYSQLDCAESARQRGILKKNAAILFESCCNKNYPETWLTEAKKKTMND